MQPNQFELGTKVSGYARLLRKRKMGKISFWTVRFNGCTIQLIFTSSLPNYQETTKIPSGSSLLIDGVYTLSKSNELSIECGSVTLAALCTRLLPDKHAAVQQESRYTDRLQTLLAEQRSWNFFSRVSQATELIRRFLWSERFQEFTTGVLQQRFESGTSQPFLTHCNANGKTYALGLTSELKLRKLQIAGFDDVFEILQSFRNEGMDPMHSPEFSLLEASKIGYNYQNMMELTERLVRFVIAGVYGTPALALASEKIDFTSPFSRISFYNACEQYLGIERSRCTLPELSKQYPELFHVDMGKFTWVFKTINKLLAPHCQQPTFITHIPSGISPLVKASDADPAVTERAELIVAGIDIADLYTDENRPEKVREAMERQSIDANVPINNEYLDVLAYGMPLSGSLGMGLNRLFLIMREELPLNIKETILFPL